MRGCPEGLLDRERSPMKTARNRAQTGVKSLGIATMGGPPRSALGQNGNSNVNTTTSCDPSSILRFSGAEDRQN